ncbi:transcript variant X1 [Nothobranchius furzeri]|uniref:Transcript variant X1 n=1 Tax=Nothobranchius furzeri TaxID=105023 RepID=A0A9D2XEU6_NOTFU|nr:transcript variant X1 [Nothobranchius furzeri]
MMTSVVSNQTRGTRDKTLPTTTTQTTQKQIQATAEQIRLAQVIYDNNDADFEDKVKQLIEVTGKTQDECMVALHDCNEDVNRAINFLLESPSDTNSWETVGKKRSLGKEGGPSDIKENREKRGEREASRGRGASNRRGRGISRGREGRSEENGFDVVPGERGTDRGRRGRGRGVGTRGRGRAAVGNRFSSQGMGTFNPADYTANSGAQQENWDGDGNETAEGTGMWGGNLEEWTSEDWNEDLSETKVFTASSAPINHIAPGHNVDLASILPKTVGGAMDSDLGAIVDGPSAEDLGQSLVFTNSHHNGRAAAHSYAHATANSYAHAASANTTYAHAALSSVIGSGFGSLNASKQAPTPDIRTSEQLNGPRLGQRTGQMMATTSNSSVSKDAGPPSLQIPAPAHSSSADVKAQRVENGPVMSQTLESKFQPEPSAVLSQLAQRQQQSSILTTTTDTLGLSQTHAPQVPTPPGHESSIPSVRDGSSPGGKLSGLELPVAEVPQRQLKTQKRRAPPPSKIPSSAVEMPGSADIPGLNVQFGALDFGSEAGAGDMSQTEPSREHPPALVQTNIPTPAAVPSQQPQSSIFPKPGAVSEHMSSVPSAVSDGNFPSPSLGLPSATPSPSLGLPSAAATPSSSSVPATTSRMENSGPRSLPSHLGFSQSKDVPSTANAPLTNGYSGMKTQGTQETSSRTIKTESVMTNDSGSGHHIPSPAATPSHSTPVPSMNSHVSSTHSSGSTLSPSSSHSMAEESNNNLYAISTSSSQVVNPGAPPSVSNSSTNGVHQSGGPGLTSNGTNTTVSAAGSRTAPQLTATSGKAPPNLAQGVPPLLASQYIMGPGGLLPAYPQIYGYEDLQMLQSRLPLHDYYGVTFPGATMPGREGLANNPYSGEATKFGRNDSSSPAPPTSLSTAGVQSQPQQTQQTGTPGQGLSQNQGQQTQNQAFLNPPIPPGYGYTDFFKGLPYYTGMPGVPSAFQYGPTVFVPPASAKQPAMGLANPSSQYHQHQPSYGQHAYGAAFDDLSQAHGGEYSKAGYGGSAQSQAKSAGSGPGKAAGLSGSGTGGGVPDMGGSIYSKTQSFEKQGFHTGTPPPFSLPSALGGTGPMNPAGAPGYAPAPFLHILPPHQQPHSQLLHHHLTQDGQGGPGQRSQSNSLQQKTQGSKSSYGSSPYWAN